MCGSSNFQDSLSKEEIELLLPMPSVTEPIREATVVSKPDDAQLMTAESSMSHFVPADDSPRRITCKARGLSASHNADTAYFEIPANPRHGMLLVCSHPECIRTGRKFRYCAVCQLPVAKRNFMKRHSHKLVRSKRANDENVMNPNLPFLEDEDKVQLQREQQQRQKEIFAAPTTTGNKHRRAVSYGASDIMVEGFVSDEHQPNKRPRITSDSRMFPSDWPSLTRETLPSIGAKLNSETQPTGYNESNKVVRELNDRELKWLDLLSCRPSVTDATGTQAWLDEVFQASEKHASSVKAEPENTGVAAFEDLRACTEPEHQTSGEVSSSGVPLEMPEMFKDLEPLAPYKRHLSGDSVNLKEFVELFG